MYCSPGENKANADRHQSADAVAKLNHRYSVPMSLWFVVVTQRISPLRGPWMVVVRMVVAVAVRMVVVVDNCAHGYFLQL